MLLLILLTCMCGDDDEMTRKYNVEPNYFHEQSLTQNLSTLHPQKFNTYLGIVAQVLTGFA